MFSKSYHIHFVGIGGIGMSGIAEILLHHGYRVSGSDLAATAITRRLRDLGAVVFKGHDAAQIEGADVVVISSAVKEDNPERAAAGAAGIPVVQRAVMLAELMRGKFSVAVAGAHGKTSTTAMVASVLQEGRLDPTVVIGGKLNSTGTNAVAGKGDYIVVEADESDGSFLNYTPAIAVVTNIDLEHVDYYENLEAIKQGFLEFIHKMPFYGRAVLCVDSEPVRELIPRISNRIVTYGTVVDADLTARNIRLDGRASRFDVVRGGETLGEIQLNLSGKHNVDNALAAVAVGLELGLAFTVIQKALAATSGVKRRMEIKGTLDGVTVVDDYGHHPTEIQTTLDAVDQAWPGHRKVVVFQPHRYTRTRTLFDAFAKVFGMSDILMLLPIYSAGESPIAGVDSRALCEKITAAGHENVIFVEGIDRCVARLHHTLKSGDLLLTLGAGDVHNVGERLLAGALKTLKTDTE